MTLKDLITRAGWLVLLVALIASDARAGDCGRPLAALEVDGTETHVDLAGVFMKSGAPGPYRPELIGELSHWCEPASGAWRVTREAGVHWFGVRVRNGSAGSIERIFRIDGPFPDSVALYSLGSDGVERLRPFQRDSLAWQFDVAPGETVSLMLSVDASSFEMHAGIYDVPAYVETVALRHVLVSSIIGSILCMLLFQVFSASALREHLPLTATLSFAFLYEWVRLDYHALLLLTSLTPLPALELPLLLLGVCAGLWFGSAYVELPREGFVARTFQFVAAVFVLLLLVASVSTELAERGLLFAWPLLALPVFAALVTPALSKPVSQLLLASLPFVAGSTAARLAADGVIDYHFLLPLMPDAGLAGSLLFLVMLAYRKLERSRRVQEGDLKETQRRYQLALEGSNDGIFEWDVESGRILASQRAHEIVGVDFVPGWRSERIIDEIIDEDELERIRTMRKAMFVERDVIRIETFCVDAAGRRTWLLVQGKLDFDQHMKPARLIGAVSDVSEQKRLETRLRHDALHDFLTGLPNRTLLIDRLQRTVERLKRNADARASLLFIDFDNFKSINDSLGHSFGDEVLVSMGRRLSDLVRSTDTVARIGGDEFVILLEEMRSRREAERFAERILGKLRMPLEIRGQQLMPSVSIGLTLVDDGNESVEMVLGDADIAMYAAKERGKGRVVAFETTMRTRAARRLEIEAALRQAVEQDELRLVYQPIFEIDRKGVTPIGAEALLRWDHSERQDIAPSDLLSLAEENGMIEAIGRWVIRTAANQLAVWRGAGYPEEFYVNINLSSVHFESDEILSDILGALDPLGVSRNALRIEVVESAVIRHPEKALSVIKLLQSQGILVSMDDFGTGYSSLSYLHQFPFYSLKIDRTFVQDLAESRATRDIVTAIIMMARRLGIRVVAEGIETAPQLNFLRSIGCDMAQGFLLARPGEPGDLHEYFLPADTVVHPKDRAGRAEIFSDVPVSA